LQTQYKKMALNNNNFGVSSASGGGEGCSTCGVMSLGMCGGFGISVTPTNPITTTGTFIITNLCPYLGESVEVLDSGTCSTLRCGNNNIASGNCSASLGGNNNSTLSLNSTIVGGSTNTICFNNADTNSFIGGGSFNTINSSDSVIFGGTCINANFNQCFSGGGLGTTIIGGQCHNVSSVNSGLFSFIGGGFCNQALGNISSANSGCNIVILGGFCNYVCNCGTSIGGGCCNCNTRSVSSIIGGFCNSILSGGNCNIIGGGVCNTIVGSFSSFGGGFANSINGSFSNIFGGYSNNIQSDCSIIGGGKQNSICCNLNTLLGGCLNKICLDTNNFIGGGYSNTICGQANSSSGYLNTIIGCFSNISGNQNCINNVLYGSNNGCLSTITNSCNSTNNAYNSCISGNLQNDILGGTYNCIVGTKGNTILIGCQNNILNANACCIDFGLILNGCLNCLDGGGDCVSYSCYSTILNGTNNYSNSSLAFIGNGSNNNILYTSSYCGFSSALVGGVGNNTNSGYWDSSTCNFTTSPQIQSINQFSFVGGGFQNSSVCDCFNGVIGGCNNNNFQRYSIIGGGFSNIISFTSTQKNSSIFSGSFNNIGGTDSFIGGGFSNSIFDANSVIFGGFCNVISANLQPNFFTNTFSFIGGGSNNCICGNNGCSVIFGGCANQIFGTFNNILGGCSNSIGTITYNNYQYSNILGGYANQICGNCSSILGGSYNCVASNNSFVLGSNISAIYDCTTYVNALNIISTPNTCNPPNSINLGWDSTTKNVVGVCDSTLTSFGLCSFDTIGCQNIGLDVSSGSPISGTGAIGTITMSLNKTDTTYLSGANSIENVPNVSSGGGVVYFLNGGVVKPSTPIGFYQLSNNPDGKAFTQSISADGLLSQYITDVNVPNLQIVPNGIWVINSFFSVDAGTPSVFAEVYSVTSDGITFTLLGTGSPVLINQRNEIVQYTFSVPLTNPPSFSPSTRFAIKICATNLNPFPTPGTITQYTNEVYTSGVSTTFPSGLGSLNSLIASSQNFITTTDANGDAFNITSSCCTHCFNLPTASATQLGALSCQTWGLFNSKQTTCYPSQSFYVNPTNAIANSITCQYFVCTRNNLDVSVSIGTSNPANLTITSPSGQVGEYSLMRIGAMVYYCFNFCWSNPGIITQLNTNATNVTISFPNPSIIPRPCATSQTSGQNIFTSAIGEIYFNVDGSLGTYFKKVICAPTATSCSNVFQRVGMVCCNICPQLPNLSFTRGVFQVPYPQTFTNLSGFFVYQGQ